MKPSFPSFFAVAWLLACAGASGLDDEPVVRLPNVPTRPAEAGTGTSFAQRTEKMDGRTRQGAAIDEILRGNVPEFLRHLRPVVLEATGPDGASRSAVIWVTADYVAIGTDADFLRMPLTMPSATRIANAFDAVLPTPRIVDAVYRQAERKLTPAPLPPGPRMRSTAYYLRHRDKIEGERGDLAPGILIAGHKKDVVLTNRLKLRRDRIAIYGWHRRDGTPIQPVSTVHGARYADYSHGVRLVWKWTWIDDRWVSMYDALADPDLAGLFSNDGPIPEARTLMSLPAGADESPPPDFSPPVR